MEKFAKLFETEAHGQILVKFGEAPEGGPEVRFYFRPVRLGICSVAISAAETDKGWAAMEEAFMQQTEESAAKVVTGVKKQLEGLEEDE